MATYGTYGTTSGLTASMPQTANQVIFRGRSSNSVDTDVNQTLPLSDAPVISLTENSPNLNQIQAYPVVFRDGEVHIHQDPISGQRYSMTDILHMQIIQMNNPQGRTSTSANGVPTNVTRTLNSVASAISSTSVDQYLKNLQNYEEPSVQLVSLAEESIVLSNINSDEILDGALGITQEATPSGGMRMGVTSTNANIPGVSTPEQKNELITRIGDGIKQQETARVTMNRVMSTSPTSGYLTTTVDKTVVSRPNAMINIGQSQINNAGFNQIARGIPATNRFINYNTVIPVSVNQLQRYTPVNTFRSNFVPITSSPITYSQTTINKIINK